MSNFPTDIDSIEARIDAVDPIDYPRTRNFIDGSVTYLSPYISRGVISTKTVLERVLSRGYEPFQITKFIQELAWREYFQRVWQTLGDGIEADIRGPQPNIVDRKMPSSVIEAATGIDSVDREVLRLIDNGYMHNHVRMYTAAICCNVAMSHWATPAKWMYYHLLDGDHASNTLSWQWIAGTFSSKRYIADQANVNRFTRSDQRGTFLDRPYDQLLSGKIPSELKEKTSPVLECKLPDPQPPAIDNHLPTVVYTTYNLDPTWRQPLSANRLLLLEPSHFNRYPVSSNVMSFILRLAANIDGIQAFVGEFAELAAIASGEIIYREHPFSRHFSGTRDEREWMFETDGYYRSFSSYWKRCERELRDSRRGLFDSL